MYLIAKKLGVALDALIKANTQAKPENIYPGLVLNVPAEASQPAQSPQPFSNGADCRYLNQFRFRHSGSGIVPNAYD